MKTIRERFRIPEALTRRDEAAPDLGGVLTRSQHFPETTRIDYAEEPLQPLHQEVLKMAATLQERADAPGQEAPAPTPPAADLDALQTVGAALEFIEQRFRELGLWGGLVSTEDEAGKKSTSVA